MTQRLTINDINIYARKLPEGLTRHERAAAERRAVTEMVAELFGSRAMYGHTPDGAPTVTIPGIDAPCISVSHGAGMALLAVAAHPIGIDIESPRDQLSRVASRFVNQGELTGPTTVDALLHVWTAKEAAFKAAGLTGLTLIDLRLEGDTVITPAGTRFSISHHRLGDALIAVAIGMP